MGNIPELLIPFLQRCRCFSGPELIEGLLLRNEEYEAQTCIRICFNMPTHFSFIPGKLFPLWVCEAGNPAVLGSHSYSAVSVAVGHFASAIKPVTALLIYSFSFRK